MKQTLTILLSLVLVACQSQREDPMAAADCRPVEHFAGTTCIPNTYSRVITLDGGSFEMAVALGLDPVGTVASDLLPHMTEALSNTADIGTAGEPSLERILALSPDLIIGYDFHAPLYPQLSEIAPTVLHTFEHSGLWKEGFWQLATYLDRIDSAQEVMDRYDAQIEEFRAQMQDQNERFGRQDPLVISVLRIYPDSINIYLKDSFLGTVLDDAGLDRPEQQRIAATDASRLFDNPIQRTISLEVLSEVDGDAIFIWTGQNTEAENQVAQEQLEILQSRPLWNQLGAVQSGQVFQVPSYWIGSGPIAAQAILDDLFKYLIDE